MAKSRGLRNNIYDAPMRSAPQATAEELYNAISPNETQFTKGLRSGFAHADAGSFASEALAKEAQLDPNWRGSLRNAAQIMQQSEMYAPRVRSLRDANTAEDYMDLGTGMFGQGLASMAPTLAAATIARPLGAMVGRAGLASFAGASIPAYQMEHGEAALGQYMDPKLSQTHVLDRQRAASSKALINAGLEAAVPAALTGGLTRLTAAGLAGRTGAGILGEGATETAQELSGYAAERSLDPGRELAPYRLADAGLAGAITGGGVSFGTGLPGSMLEKYLAPDTGPSTPLPGAPNAGPSTPLGAPMPPGPSTPLGSPVPPAGPTSTPLGTPPVGPTPTDPNAPPSTPLGGAPAAPAAPPQSLAERANALGRGVGNAAADVAESLGFGTENTVAKIRERLADPTLSSKRRAKLERDLARYEKAGNTPAPRPSALAGKLEERMNSSDAWREAKLAEAALAQEAQRIQQEADDADSLNAQLTRDLDAAAARDASRQTDAVAALEASRRGATPKGTDDLATESQSAAASLAEKTIRETKAQRARDLELDALAAAARDNADPNDTLDALSEDTGSLRSDSTAADAVDIPTALGQVDEVNKTKTEKNIELLRSRSDTAPELLNLIDSVGGRYDESFKNRISAAVTALRRSGKLADAVNKLPGNTQHNLQGLDIGKFKKLTFMLVERLGVAQAFQAPKLAQQLMAYASRVSSKTKATSRIRALSEVLDNDVLAVVEALTGKASLRKAIGKIRAIPSAENDVAKSDGNSFLSSLIPSNIDPGHHKTIAKLVDQYAKSFESRNPEIQRKVITALAQFVGGPERAQAALQYYGALATQAARQEAKKDAKEYAGEKVKALQERSKEKIAKLPPEKAKEAGDALAALNIGKITERLIKGYERAEVETAPVSDTDIDDGAPSAEDTEAEIRGQSDPEGMDGEMGTGLNIREGGPKGEYQFADPKTKRPYSKEEVGPAMRKLRATNPMVKVRKISMRTYTEMKEEQPSFAVKEILRDLNERWKHAKGEARNVLRGMVLMIQHVRDSQGYAEALKNFYVLRIEDRDANPLMATDEDLHAFSNLNRKETKETAEGIRQTIITFKRKDGSRFALSAESMWKTMSEKSAGEKSGELHEPRVRRLLHEAVASVMARPEVVGIVRGGGKIVRLSKTPLKRSQYETRVPTKLNSDLLIDRKGEITVKRKTWPGAAERKAVERAAVKAAQPELDKLGRQLDDQVTKYKELGSELGADDAQQKSRKVPEGLREKVTEELRLQGITGRIAIERGITQAMEAGVKERPQAINTHEEFEERLDKKINELESQLRWAKSGERVPVRGKKGLRKSPLAGKRHVGARAVLKAKLDLYKHARSEMQSYAFEIDKEYRDNDVTGVAGDREQTGTVGTNRLPHSVLNTELSQTGNRVYDETTGLAVRNNKDIERPIPPKKVSSWVQAVLTSNPEILAGAEEAKQRRAERAELKAMRAETEADTGISRTVKRNRIRKIDEKLDSKELKRHPHDFSLNRMREELYYATENLSTADLRKQLAALRTKYREIGARRAELKALRAKTSDDKQLVKIAADIAALPQQKRAYMYLGTQISWLLNRRAEASMAEEMPSLFGRTVLQDKIEETATKLRMARDMLPVAKARAEAAAAKYAKAQEIADRPFGVRLSSDSKEMAALLNKAREQSAFAARRVEEDEANVAKLEAELERLERAPRSSTIANPERTSQETALKSKLARKQSKEDVEFEAAYAAAFDQGDFAKALEIEAARESVLKAREAEIRAKYEAALLSDNTPRSEIEKAAAKAAREEKEREAAFKSTLGGATGKNAATLREARRLSDERAAARELKQRAETRRKRFEAELAAKDEAPAKAAERAEAERKFKQSRIDIPRGPTVPLATRKAVEAEIRRIRGKDISISWEKHMPWAGDYTPNDADLGRLIRISVYASAPMQTGRHETLHDFFSMINGIPQGRTIRRDLSQASNTPQIKNQLRRHLAGYPAAIEQMESTEEERIAYMFQFWSEGLLDTLGPTSTNIFRKIAQFFKEVFGLVSTMERAEDLMSALRDGKFTDPDTVANVLADMPRDFVRNKLDRALPIVNKTLNKVFTAGTNRLRDFHNEELNDLADKFDRQIRKRNQQHGVWTNQLAEIFKGTTSVERRAALENLQSGKDPQPGLETQISEYLKKMLRYSKGAGVLTFDNETKKWVNQRAVDGYFPRVWDRKYIADHADQFEALLVSHGVSVQAARKTIKAIKHGDGRLELVEDEHSLGYTPFASGTIERKFKFITKRNAHEFAPFQKKDLADVMRDYTEQVVHRAEYVREFGNQGYRIANTLEDAKLPAADLMEVGKIIQGLEGTLGSEMSVATKELMSGIQTLENLVILPMAIFSQMIDPIVLAARSGDIRDAGTAYINVLKRLKGQKIDGEDLAKWLGIVAQDAALQAVGGSFEAAQMSGNTRMINRVFFKYNGMQGFNDTMRMTATHVAERYLIAHKDDAKALREVHLEPADIKLVPGSGKLDMSSTKIQEAMFEFVDQAVLRPSATTRPIWMSDQRWLLFAHLKQFTFAMHNVVLKRANDQLADDNVKPWATLMLAMPTILAADIAKFALVGGPSGWGFMQYLTHAVERSGLLGIGDFSVQATRGVSTGAAPGESMLGPTFEHLMKLLRYIGGDPQTSFRDVVDRTIPGARFLPQSEGGAP